ncbi:hypothetical protein C8R48DRAFT_189990 [Suillus tomentosus]|nr:hypothetical protein C8R48DRAFT_189990 [Suillus tomentosus]
MTEYKRIYDRSAHSLEGHSYYPLEYPSFLVGMGAACDTSLRKTEDHPIWSSLSLLGRGTATWRAVLAEDESKKNEVVSLKTLWKSRTRESESNAYGHVKPPLPGAAELSLGDDVYIPLGRETHARVAVGTLRFLILNDNTGVPDGPILHSLALTTVRRPLCDADTTKDFILGSIAALRGHQRLVEQVILH